MRRLLALAGVLSVAMLPLAAQRGAEHGSPAGRGAAAPPARTGGAGSPHVANMAGPPGLPSVPHFISPPPLNATGAPSAAAGLYSQNRGAYRADRNGRAGHEYRGRNGYGGVYPGVLAYGIPDYGYFGDGLEPAAAYSADVAPPVINYEGPGAFYPAGPVEEQAAVESAPARYEPPAPVARSAPPAPAPAPEEEDPVTIVFKDGRASEQVRNYALTRTTLYVTGRRLREIPLDQIDVPATEKVNRAAGVAFQVPQAK